MHSWLAGHSGEHSFSRWWGSPHLELPVRLMLESAHTNPVRHSLHDIPAGHVSWMVEETTSPTSAGRHPPVVHVALHTPDWST